MAGQVKVLKFSEGVSTGAPTQVGVTATNVSSFASDAAFIADKGSAAADSDFYYNTTTDLIRYFSDGAWSNLVDDDSTQVLSNKSFSSVTNFTDTTQSTNKDTGAVVVEGGVGIEKNLNVGGNVVIDGDFQVNGTKTEVFTATLDVEDANITVNKGGNQSTANTNVSGFKVEMSDATHAQVGYDSTLASKFKAGEVGSESEVITANATQSMTNKTVNKVTLTAPATGCTITVADGKTATINNTLTLTGTDGSTANLRTGGTVKYIGDYTTTATAAGTTTLTVSSTEQQYFTGTTTQTVVLPVTSTLVLGQQFLIKNLSTGIVTVQSSGANTIQAMAPETILIVTVILTSGTGTASWSASYVYNNSVIAPTQQIFTSSSGTYTLPTSPRKPIYIRARLVGGGGGGGGGGNASAGFGAGGGGGGGGGYIESIINNPSSSYSYSVGSGGSGGGVGSSGSGGGSTTFSTYTASGGNSGTGGSTVLTYGSGGGGGSGSGASINSYGNSGSLGGVGQAGAAQGIGGDGGGSFFGGGGQPGGVGQNFGGGGGGGGGAASGGNGASGVVIVDEFYQ